MTFEKGNIPWNKSKIGIGGGNKNGNLGYKYTPEQRLKRSLQMKKNWEGKEERREEYRRRITGSGNPTKRKEVSDKISKSIKEKWKDKSYRKKVVAGHIGIMTGTSNPNWQGGKSFELYGLEFNNFLRGQIRQRDDFTCQLCNVRENGQKHDIHHIDYDKTNNQMKNLITLCHSCHSKTNFNRKYWIEVFSNI